MRSGHVSVPPLPASATARPAIHTSTAEQASYFDLLSSLDEDARARFLARLSPQDRQRLRYDWRAYARPNQREPAGDWRLWLLLAGRGYGKNRAAGEWVRSKCENGVYGRIGMVAATAADARDIMVEGESGILHICPPWNRPQYEPSKRRLTWPNGALCTIFSADDPERMRGSQFEGAWTDEICAWRYPQETFDQLMFGLRLGRDPRCVITTTPKPIPLLRSIMARPGTVVTGGSSYENRGNLAPAFYEQIISVYEGTRLGRQEILAEILEDTEGALWQRERMIDAHRVRSVPDDLVRVVIGIDPAGGGTAETGIVAAGVDAAGHGYILADASQRSSPDSWARSAVNLYHSLRADRIVAEQNYGGEMVRSTLLTVDSTVAYEPVHASRGKALRAEPVAALYEQGRVHHVGNFPVLEDQQCTWVPGDKSPDRLDALVWCLTHLLLQPRGGGVAVGKPRFTARDFGPTIDQRHLPLSYP